MKIRVVDIETITTEPHPNGIVEIGYTDVVAMGRDLLGEPNDWEVGETWSTLVNPMQPITPETQAIHHIDDEDVRGSLPWGEVWPLVFRGEEHEGVIAYAAHGASFERSFIGTDITGDIPWIDTYRCALWLHPDAPSHSNQTLRYYLRPRGLDRRKADPVHRAGPDSYVTAFHVRDFLNGKDGETNSVQKLVKWTENPALLPRCKIGEQYRNGGKGTPWPEVESGFLTWILSKDFDADTVHTVRNELERRAIDQRLERERADLASQLDGGRPFAPPQAYEGEI